MSDVIWDGKGLPPVGSICEVMHGASLKRCNIAAHVNQFGKMQFIYQLINSWNYGEIHEFRAIKSERDKAIEDMEKIAIEAHSSLNHDLRIIDDISIKAIYDAGYRKINT